MHFIQSFGASIQLEAFVRGHRIIQNAGLILGLFKSSRPFETSKTL
jgi:hypothetical protein